MVQKGYEEIYRRFVMGKLIYKPRLESDSGRIEFSLRDLVNPLEGRFNLSRCGKEGKYLSIATGYKKGKNPENSGKVEIWITPRFLVEREQDSDAQHLKPILDKWDAKKAPIGIFWTWGDDRDITRTDYLVTDSMAELGSDNLHDKWKKCHGYSSSYSGDVRQVEDHSDWRGSSTLFGKCEIRPPSFLFFLCF